jgi:transcriptional regulator with XRE-family HTH domain
VDKVMAGRGGGSTPGALLTRTRLELGLDQASMAARLGLTQQTLSKLERDLYPPSLAVMERAAAAAGKTFAFLFVPRGWEVQAAAAGGPGPGDG